MSIEREECAGQSATTDSAGRPERVAILVVHGMGTQKPYETLDQFARGLEQMLRGRNLNYTREIRYRQHDEDPAHQQKAWTQAFVRLQPPSGANPMIDLVEYYWAPIINGRVKALKSLRFLISSALSPFSYLRANMLVIDEVTLGSAQDRKLHRQDFHRSWAGEVLYILFRELSRSVFIFTPVILLCGLLYGVLAQPLLNLLVKPTSTSGWHYFWACNTAGWKDVAFVILAGIRWLFVWMLAKYFLDRKNDPATLTKQQKNSILLCDLLVGFLLAVVLLCPVLKDMVLGVFPLHATLGPGSFTHQVLERGFAIWAEARLPLRWIAFAPICLRLVHVSLYALLALLTYAVNRFLTTAIGDLVVYLGSDELSTNYEARAQILSECTATVEDLLQTHPDVPGEGRYDRLLIAAHSLGSVISYDVLNDLLAKEKACQPAEAPEFRRRMERIAGLFTFGCPLNKVYYFFRRRTGPKTTILNEILFRLHCFRLRVPQIADHDRTAGQKLFSARFQWLNAWCKMDVISGRMVFYRADENRIVAQGWEPATAHLGYWKNPKLYDYFAELLLAD